MFSNIQTYPGPLGKYVLWYFGRYQAYNNNPTIPTSRLFKPAYKKIMVNTQIKYSGLGNYMVPTWRYSSIKLFKR